MCLSSRVENSFGMLRRRNYTLLSWNKPVLVFAFSALFGVTELTRQNDGMPLEALGVFGAWSLWRLLDWAAFTQCGSGLWWSELALCVLTPWGKERGFGLLSAAGSAWA